MFEKADRLRKLPPYLFKEIDRKKTELRAKGMDLIDLGIGDPDLPTPAHIIEAVKKAVADSANHRYPSYSGMLEFRAAVAEWYRNRFSVDLDPEKKFSPSSGAKRGLPTCPLPSSIRVTCLWSLARVIPCTTLRLFSAEARVIPCLSTGKRGFCRILRLSRLTWFAVQR